MGPPWREPPEQLRGFCWELRTTPAETSLLPAAVKRGERGTSGGRKNIIHDNDQIETETFSSLPKRGDLLKSGRIHGPGVAFHGEDVIPVCL